MFPHLKSLLKRTGLFELLKIVWFQIIPAALRLGITRYYAGRKFGIALQSQPGQIIVRQANREIRISSRHEIYLWDMVVFFDYYHSAVVPAMTHGVAVVDYSRPALQKLARSGVEFEFPSLPESDESTEIYLSYLAVKPGDAVLDLGAYAGASAYFFAKAAGTDGIVVAFEPDEINFQYLKANIARHHLTTVRPVEKGVWSETTSLQFQAEGNLGSSAATISGRKSNVKWVPVLSLEAAAQLTEGKRVAAIKMDIEGAEVAVLKQAGGFLRQHRPRLVIEPHSVDGKMVTEEVCQILQSYGYVTERLSQGSQNWPLIAARPAID